MIAYLEDHLIMKIGVDQLSDMIVDDIPLFLKTIKKTQYYISNIEWWEHLLISDREKSIGGGGPIDKNNEKFYYSEMYYMSNSFSPDTSEEELLTYIEQCKKAYPNNNIYPSFTLKSI
jgi:hypothetical protein